VAVRTKKNGRPKACLLGISLPQELLPDSGLRVREGGKGVEEVEKKEGPR